MKRNTFTRVLKSLLLILFILGVGEVGWGQTSITAFNSAVTQNFDGLGTANGTWSNNSTLPGWYIKTDLTATISNYYINNGSVVTPGEFCSFGSTSDRAVGFIPSASFTGASGTGKGYIGWRLKNNTSKSIGSFQVNWTGEQWRKEVAGSQNIVLSYQIGNSVSDLTSGTYTLAASQFDSPITGGSSATVLNGNTAANRVVLTKTLNITIPAGQEIMFRWEDLNDPANHLLSIDDISFTALKESQTITFNVLGPRPYINGSTFALGATASSGLSVTYVSNNTGVISISGSTATIHSAGQATITASQAGNGTYVAAVDVLQVQIIVPAAPVATSATGILSSGFSANWNASSGGAEEYWVYVSTDNFLNPDNELMPASAFAALTRPVSGLMPNTTYYYRIRAKAGTEYSPYSNIIQVTTGAGVQTFNITQSVNGFTTTTLTWENGNLDNRVVFLKEGIGTCPNPTNDNAYTSSTDWTVKGDQIGSSGFFCIYDGSGSTVDLTNLYPGRTYTVQAFEYSGGYFTEKYLTNVSGANNPITFATLAHQTSNIIQSVNGFTSSTLTWTNGDLANRVVFLKEGTGACTNPINNKTYEASTNWSFTGSQAGSSGFYCIYNGSGSTVNITNLYPGRTYTVQAFEYSGGNLSEQYLTSISGTNNPITFAPWGTTTFTNTTPGQATAENWTTAARWDHVTVPTAALHSAVLVYIDGNCEVTTTVVANNLTINVTHSSINPKLSITPNHTLTINNTLTNNNGTGGLVINSDETGTGSLMHNTANVNATVQRYISGTPNLLAKKYHLVSVPINSTTYLSNVWLDSYLFTYIESTNLWHIWDSPTTNTLQTKQGAMVFYPNWDATTSKTYNITGQLNNGSYSPTVTYSGSGKGVNLVPNPYPSAIDWNAASGWTKTNIGGNIYGFDANAGNYGVWNGSTGSLNVTNIIPVGQAFYVIASTSPVLTMDNNVRLNHAATFLKSSTTVANILHLVAAGNGGRDEIALQFAADATNTSADKYDAIKFYGTMTMPQLSTYTVNDASLLSISGLPTVVSSSTVPLRFEMDFTGEVVFTASGMGSFNETSIQLEDKQLTQLIDLNTKPVYTFTHTPGDALDRFVLHFTSTLTGINKIEAPKLAKVTASGNEIYLQYPSATNSKLTATVYDLQGRVISQVKLSGTGSDHISIRTSGAYLVKLNLSAGVETHKIVVL